MPRLSQVPDVGAEVLRLLIVGFGAAVAFRWGSWLQVDDPEKLLGIVDATTVGVIVGARLGYSAGGVVSRRVLPGITRGEQRLAATDAPTSAMAALATSGGPEVHLARPGKESRQVHVRDATRGSGQQADHRRGDTFHLQLAAVTATSPPLAMPAHA